MQIQPNQTAYTKLMSKITNKDYYKTQDGVKISTQKGTGKVDVADNNVVKIYDAKKVSVYGTKGDDQVIISNSHVKYVAPKGGNNKTMLDKCTFNKYNKLWGTGSTIITGTNGFINSYKKGSDEIVINGDFSGKILAQQGAGKGYGDDSKAHKDTIVINGNNYGYINIDSHDKVAVKGKEKGKIVNTTVYYV